MAQESVPRTQVRRLPERGRYDRETLDAVLDEGLVCHVGFQTEAGTFVIPTAYWRHGDFIYFHGASSSRMLRHLEAGAKVCLCVTLFDGLVLARSAFHHSMNYRSAVIFGVPELVEGPHKPEALRHFTERVAPGRWEEIRRPNEQELKATTVLRLKLEEFSVKQRMGPPKDDEQDYAMHVWAGVIPAQVRLSEPVRDPRLPEDVAEPEHVTRIVRRQQR